MQNTLLGLAIVLALALIAALVGPHYVDWNDFRPRFEAEASRLAGVPVRLRGPIDARLLPSPSLVWHDVVIGPQDDTRRFSVREINAELALGSLMRGEWRATDVELVGIDLAVTLGDDGRLDDLALASLPVGAVGIDRLRLSGDITAHDRASQHTLALTNIVFSGEVRQPATALRGEGTVTVDGARVPFRLTLAKAMEGNGARLKLVADHPVRRLHVDAEGVVTLAQSRPSFDGLVSALYASASPLSEAVLRDQLRMTARGVADPAGARFEKVELLYGSEETGARLVGTGAMTFGRFPSLASTLTARQLDFDRLAVRDAPLRGAIGDPPSGPGHATNDLALRAPLDAIGDAGVLIGALTAPAIPVTLDVNVEAATFGGRPLQGFALAAAGHSNGWRVDRLEARLPGATRASLTGAIAARDGGNQLRGQLRLEAADADALLGWLDGREAAARAPRPLRLQTEMVLGASDVGADAITGTLGGSTFSGSFSLKRQGSEAASRLEASFKADDADLDAATQWFSASSRLQPPRDAEIALDLGRARALGRDWSPLSLRVTADTLAVTVAELNATDAAGIAFALSGRFRRDGTANDATLKARAPSLDAVAVALQPLWPALAARLAVLPERGGAVDATMGMTQAEGSPPAFQLDLSSPQLTVTMSARAEAGDARLATLMTAPLTIDASLKSPKAETLLVLAALDDVITAPRQDGVITLSARGALGETMVIDTTLRAGPLDVVARGKARPLEADGAQAEVDLVVSGADLTPMAAPAIPPVPLIAAATAHLAIAPTALRLTAIDGTVATVPVRGSLTVERRPQGAVMADLAVERVDLGPALRVALGASSTAADSDPFPATLLRRWRGKASLAIGTLRVSDVLTVSDAHIALEGDGQQIVARLDRGGMAGGRLSSEAVVIPGSAGLSVKGQLRLDDAEAGALRHGALALPEGRLSAMLAAESQGRSVVALIGSLSGQGTMNLTDLRIAALDPAAFQSIATTLEKTLALDTLVNPKTGAIRASDTRMLVETATRALDAGPFSVAQAQWPIALRDGRVTMPETLLEGDAARLTVSGSYDLGRGVWDSQGVFLGKPAATSIAPPSLRLTWKGDGGQVNRTLDTADLARWLMARAIEHQLRRLETLERETAPSPAMTTPAPVSPAAPASAPAPALVPPPAMTTPAPAEMPPGGPPPTLAPSPEHAVPSPPLPTSPAPGPAMSPSGTIAAPPFDAPPIDVSPAVRPPDLAPLPRPRPKPRKPVQPRPPQEGAAPPSGPIDIRPPIDNARPIPWRP